MFTMFILNVKEIINITFHFQDADEEKEVETANQIPKINNPFDPTLEGYRARQIQPPEIIFPDIEPSFIPYWSASQASLRSDEEGN